MKSTSNEPAVSDQSPKPRKARSREVSSRYLSPNSTSSHESGIPSPNSQSLSPIGHKPATATTTSVSSNARKQQHKSLDDPALMRGLWPSSATTTSSSSTSKNSGTLGDHLGNERLKDRKKDKKSLSGNDNGGFLNRQRSSSEFGRFENHKESAKENNRPRIGGSMRYTEKLTLPGKSSSSSKISGILSGRLSADESDFYRKNYESESDYFTDTFDLDSESGKMGSPTTGKSSASSRKLGIEVPSKYMTDISARRVSDSYVPVSFDNFPSSQKFTIKKAIKRVNSLSSAKSQWALSPGRSGSAPMSVENKGKSMSFSSLKPPNSPSRAKGVEKLLNMGWDLLKGKKSSSSSSSSFSSLPALQPGNLESIHQLRLLHNRLMQWRYANARAVAVNGSITNQAKVCVVLVLLICMFDKRETLLSFFTELTSSQDILCTFLLSWHDVYLMYIFVGFVFSLS